MRWSQLLQKFISIWKSKIHFGRLSKWKTAQRHSHSFLISFHLSPSVCGDRYERLTLFECVGFFCLMKRSGNISFSPIKPYNLSRKFEMAIQAHLFRETRQFDNKPESSSFRCRHRFCSNTHQIHHVRCSTKRSTIFAHFAQRTSTDQFNRTGGLVSVIIFLLPKMVFCSHFHNFNFRTANFIEFTFSTISGWMIRQPWMLR